jgi:uncharacterized repeat protein (TIGR01451 family)
MRLFFRARIRDDRVMRLKAVAASIRVSTVTLSAAIAVCATICVIDAKSDRVEPPSVPVRDAIPEPTDDTALSSKRPTYLTSNAELKDSDPGIGDKTYIGNWFTISEKIKVPAKETQVQLKLGIYGMDAILVDGAYLCPEPDVPILELHKEGTPDLVEAGGSLIYTINFSNTGNLIANAVAVTDVLDVHVHFAGSVPEPERGSGDVWVWEFDELGIGRSDSVVITVAVDSPLTNSLPLTNVVYIRSEIPRTEIISNTEIVTVSSVPVLGLAKIDSPDPVDPGALLTYTIVYSNSGNANATGASVRENYDFLTCFVTATLRRIASGWEEPFHHCDCKSQRLSTRRKCYQKRSGS